MRLFICFLLLVFSTRYVTAQGKAAVKSAQEFTTEVDSSGLIYKMPEGYHAIPVKENPYLAYAFAIKHNSEDFEIRYIYWSIAKEAEDYKKCKLDTNCKMEDPNSGYRNRIQTALLPLTNGNGGFIAKFPKEEVNKEFNGDEGGYTFFKLTSDFAKDYSVAQAVTLHKENIADILIIYLSNNRTLHEQLMLAPFDALKFK